MRGILWKMDLPAVGSNLLQHPIFGIYDNLHHNNNAQSSLPIKNVKL